MGKQAQDELEQLEMDMAISFENFRATEPGTYLGATPTASAVAAELFMRRFLDWHKRQLRAEIANERQQIFYLTHDVLADKKIPRHEALKYFKERFDNTEGANHG